MINVFVQENFMLIPRYFVSIFSVGLMVVGAGVAYGQDYPNKPIRILASGPSGSNDFSARIIAQGISDPLGQQAVVENRLSAVIGEIAAKAPPDGYTLLVAADSLFVLPLIRKMSYDAARDFSPVSLIARAPLIFVVHPSLPVKSVKELIALAKARPGELNYGSTSPGSPNQLAAELFKSMAGVNIVQISYKGSGVAAIGLISGEVQVTFDTGASLTPHIKSGKLRALGITTAKPSALFPDLPTVAETLPGYDAGLLAAMFVPAKTPTTIITRLNQEIVRLLSQAEVRKKFVDGGLETVGSSPEELATTVKSDMVKWSKVIKDAGIRVD
ncbi:MAG: tripartite tricarboxylate transporter substrate binding protein [Betaproteobacteria bacterium]|nr:tripartite tricarboxylate transporter substrate binding protein [Betaproteobacteria bacterium]